MSESWMKKHAKNLLTTRPVDDIGSALLNGKKKSTIGDQLDSKAFTNRSDPNKPRTDISKKEQSKIKIKNAKIAAERKRLRESNDPVVRKLYAKVKTLKDIGKYGK
jgi:hypothetical protein